MPPSEADTERKAVLVVDEDEDLLNVVQDAIEREGYRVLTARDGEEALLLLSSGDTPCLILLNMQTSGMQTQEFRRRQLDDSRIAGIPIVGFLGVSKEDADARLLALTSYLREPMHLHQLLETVAHYCSDPDHIDFSSSPRNSATG